jgi:hypothetical protein
LLAPAIDGFSPTPELPEIAEAQALLAALAGTDEMKNTAAQHQPRLHLGLLSQRSDSYAATWRQRNQHSIREGWRARQRHG